MCLYVKRNEFITTKTISNLINRSLEIAVSASR